MARIGLFGGSFDPIHLAHLVLAEEARDVLGLDQVIFIPARTPPHKRSRKLAAARDRVEMARLAVADHAAFSVSEMELRRKGPSYTIDTVAAMRRRFGRSAELHFLIGGDSLAELPLWRDVTRLVTLCRFVPLDRPGVPLPRLSDLRAALGEEARGILKRRIRMPRLDISSSDIRLRVAEGRSIRYLVPAAVAEYIDRRRLYRDG